MIITEESALKNNLFHKAMFLLACSVMTTAMARAASTADSDAAAPADLVIQGARIWTGDPTWPWASALAVRGDRSDRRT